MISVSATLTAAAKKADMQPYVELKAYENIGNVARLRWTRLYTGAEADTRHAALVASDGALLRARVAPNAAVHDLYYQRIASPAVGSAWSTWSDLVADVSSSAGAALAKTGTTVQLFYCDPLHRTIRQKSSSDGGATFGAPADIHTAAADISHLAAYYNTAGALTLFFVHSNAVYRMVRPAGGAWGAAAAWTNTATTITGLDCSYIADYHLIVTGTDASSHAKVWACIYGDGYEVSAGSWSALLEMMSANSGSNVTYAYPSIDVLGLTRAAFLESYSGTGTYDQTFMTHGNGVEDFGTNVWREPYPVNASPTKGIAITGSATKGYLSCPYGVWESPLSVAAVDLTDNLILLDARIDPFSGRLTATIRNDASTYLPASGGKGDAWLGCQLKLGVGYKTSAGNESSTHVSFWIDDYAYQAEKGKSRLLLSASSPWELLAGWRSRRMITWAAGSTTIYAMLRFILGKVGLDISAVGPSTPLNNWQPAFSIYPGESGFHAVQKLLAMIPDVMRFQTATGVLKNPASGDASDYAVLGTTHPILGGVYRTSAPKANRAETYATAAYGKDTQWSDLELVLDRTRQIHEPALSSAANAATRATTELRGEDMSRYSDAVTVPPVPALELYDVVSLTESRAELAASKRRVLGLRLLYDRDKATYTHTLLTGAP